MCVLYSFSAFSLDDLQGDVIAGITVGLTLIPQSIAYAGIAQLAPQVCGLVIAS